MESEGGVYSYMYASGSSESFSMSESSAFGQGQALSIHNTHFILSSRHQSTSFSRLSLLPCCNRLNYPSYCHTSTSHPSPSQTYRKPIPNKTPVSSQGSECRFERTHAKITKSTSVRLCSTCTEMLLIAASLHSSRALAISPSTRQSSSSTARPRGPRVVRVGRPANETC